MVVGQGTIGAHACVGASTTVFEQSIPQGAIIAPGSVVSVGPEAVVLQPPAPIPPAPIPPAPIPPAPTPPPPTPMDRGIDRGMDRGHARSTPSPAESQGDRSFNRGYEAWDGRAMGEDDGDRSQRSQQSPPQTSAPTPTAPPHPTVAPNPGGTVSPSPDPWATETPDPQPTPVAQPPPKISMGTGSQFYSPHAPGVASATAMGSQTPASNHFSHNQRATPEKTGHSDSREPDPAPDRHPSIPQGPTVQGYGGADPGTSAFHHHRPQTSAPDPKAPPSQGRNSFYAQVDLSVPPTDPPPQVPSPVPTHSQKPDSAISKPDQPRVVYGRDYFLQMRFSLFPDHPIPPGDP